jgi:hypothetical protein
MITMSSRRSPIVAPIFIPSKRIVFPQVLIAVLAWALKSFFQHSDMRVILARCHGRQGKSEQRSHRCFGGRTRETILESEHSNRSDQG